MRVVLTTVKEANVSIDNKIISQIKDGYLLLVGFTSGDNKEIVEKMTDKILSLRVFPDERLLINKSIHDINGDILSVSQFTLYADMRKGRRPSFVNALNPMEAEELYNYFNECLVKKYKPISTGVFGAFMEVSSINNGPFTVTLDSEELFHD